MKNIIVYTVLILALSVPLYGSENKSFFKTIFNDNKGVLATSGFAGMLTFGQLKKSNFKVLPLTGYTLLSTVATLATYLAFGKITDLSSIIIKNNDKTD